MKTNHHHYRGGRKHKDTEPSETELEPNAPEPEPEHAVPTDSFEDLQAKAAKNFDRFITPPPAES